MVSFSMAVPAMLMGQADEDLWMREPILVGLIILNSVSINAYLWAVTYADKKEQKDVD